MMKTSNKILIAIHVLLVLVLIPYAFVAWIVGITPGFYYNPVYWVNLGSIALYELSILVILLSLISKKVRANETRLKFSLRLPFLLIFIEVMCLIYFIIKYRH